MSNPDETLDRLISAAEARSETFRAIRERDKLIVGTKVDYEGVGFLLEDGSNAGVEVELSRYVAGKFLGDPAKVEFLPVVFADRTQHLLERRIDLIVATLVMTPERAEIIDASNPYLCAGGATLLARKDGPITSWETCRGQVIAGLDRAYFNPIISDRYGARIVEYPDAEAAYAAVATGLCDAMAFDEILLRRRVRRPEWSHFAIVGEPLQYHYHRIGMRKDNEALLALVNHVLLMAQAEGRIVTWVRQFGLCDDQWSLEQVAVAASRLTGQP